MLTVKAIEGSVKVFNKEQLVKEFNYYRKFKSLKEFKKVFKLPAELEPSEKPYTKHLNAAYTAYLGSTPASFMKLINAMIYKYLLLPAKEVAGGKYFKNMCFGFGGKIKNIKVHALIARKQEFEQLHKDNLDNLAPLLIKYGGKLQDVKQAVSKSTWKRLHHNSFHRNKLIANRMCGYGDIVVLQHLSSTLLYHGIGNAYGVKDEQSAKWLTKNLKGKYKTGKQLVHSFLDCRLMLSKENKEFNYNWNLEKMLEEHDKAVMRINNRKYSKDLIPSLQHIVNKQLDKFYSDNFTAELVTSRFMLAEEGTEMHHCVAGYADAIERGDYLVYSIRNLESKRYCTLGINIQVQEGVQYFGIDQCYKACNQEVDSEEVQQFVRDITAKLNCEMLDCSKI